MEVTSLPVTIFRVKNRMTYIAPLDGIRALAILAVLLFHVHPAALKGGFTGVDVFFVLSGFLISSIIRHDIREGTFSLREFYLRRIQRLLPNVIVTILAVLLLWTYCMPPNSATQPGVHGLWTLFNLSNFYVWKYLGDYWGSAAEWAPLTHFWSLGIEEQFYLLFPASLLLLSRAETDRMRFWLTAATISSFGLCLFLTHSHAKAAFYLLPTRVWELLLGAVIAVFREPSNTLKSLPGFQLSTKARETTGWAGLGMILFGFLAINAEDGFPGIASLIPTVGTALVLVSVAKDETRVSRCLSSPLLVRVGKLSYSLYLWHWPLITFGKLQADLYGIPQLYGSVAGGLAGILFAWVAYIGIERPLRNHGPGRAWRLAIIAIGFLSIVVLCGIVATRPPTKMALNDRFNTLTFYGRLFDTGRVPNTNIGPPISYADVYFPPTPPREADIWKFGGIVKLYGGGNPEILVLGSSHALMYSRLIDDICRARSISVAFLGVGAGTTVFFENSASQNFSSQEEAHEFDESRRKWLREWHPKAVFVIDRWDNRVTTPQEFDTKLRSFLKEVSPITGRVFLTAQVPVAIQGEKINLRTFIAWRMGSSSSLPVLPSDKKDHLRKQTVAIAQAATFDFPNLRVLRADIPFYQNDGSIRYAAGRNFFYADDDHLTDVGSEEVRSIFQDAITEAFTSPSATK